MLTQKDLNALYGKVKTNKYHNTKFTADGYTWDSNKEYNRWRELKLLQRAGEIWALERQKDFELIPNQDMEEKSFIRQILSIKRQTEWWWKMSSRKPPKLRCIS